MDGLGHGRQDAPGPTTSMHELQQRARLSVMTQRSHACFPNLLVKDNPLDMSVSPFHAHAMETLNLTRLMHPCGHKMSRKMEAAMAGKLV